MLAKILIYKTFGLSQILFVCATTMFSKAQDNQLTTLIYKFLWNKNIERNKAPDRLRRQILNCQIKDLGFGMIDFRDVVDRLRIKTVLRLLNNINHPLHSIIMNCTTRSVINIKTIKPICQCLDKAILQINKIWYQSFSKNPDEIPRNLIKIYLNEYIGNIICPRYQKQRLVMAHKHDKVYEIILSNPEHPILHKLEKKFKWLTQLTISTADSTDFSMPITPDPDYSGFPYNNKIIKILKLSSRAIRKTIKPPSQIYPKMISNPDINLVKKWVV